MDAKNGNFLKFHQYTYCKNNNDIQIGRSGRE